MIEEKMRERERETEEDQTEVNLRQCHKSNIPSVSGRKPSELRITKVPFFCLSVDILIYPGQFHSGNN